METNSTNIWHLIIELEKTLREHELKEDYKHVKILVETIPDAETLSQIEKRYLAVGWKSVTAYTITNPNQLGLILKK